MESRKGLGLRWFAMTNALAYPTALFITAVKSFTLVNYTDVLILQYNLQV
jgi:hypothetical protein